MTKPLKVARVYKRTEGELLYLVNLGEIGIVVKTDGTKRTESRNAWIPESFVLPKPQKRKI